MKNSPESYDEYTENNTAEAFFQRGYEIGVKVRMEIGARRLLNMGISDEMIAYICNLSIEEVEKVKRAEKQCEHPIRARFRNTSDDSFERGIVRGFEDVACRLLQMGYSVETIKKVCGLSDERIEELMILTSSRLN